MQTWQIISARSISSVRKANAPRKSLRAPFEMRLNIKRMWPVFMEKL